MATFRKIIGLTLIAIPVGAFAICYLVAMIELPPVLWTTIVVTAGALMIGAGNFLLEKSK